MARTGGRRDACYVRLYESILSLTFVSCSETMNVLVGWAELPRTLSRNPTIPDTEHSRMNLRRVVVADVDGASTVLSDDAAPRSHDFASTPGFCQAFVWTTPPNPKRRFEGLDPTLAAPSLVPPVNGTSLIVLTFPPDRVFADPGFDPVAAASEALEHSPGIAEALEPENPGMHTTPTVDYDIVLDGEIWLELSNGHEVKLVAGDIAIQHGTRHAWRNKSDRPATVAAILVGADA